MIKKYVLTPLFLLLAFVKPIQAQHYKAVDSIFSEWDNTDTPGAAVAVIKDGKLVHSKGYGLADMEHSVKINPSTVFYLASISKQFVAFSILLLEEEGKLDLDDEIQIYLPDFPKYKSPITIRHLIHHTNGLRDYGHLFILRGESVADHHTMEEAYNLLKNQKHLNHVPGEKFNYNNSGYLLLTLIIEKVSGLSFKAYAEQNIFNPLGMENTLVYDDISDKIENRAFSYGVSNSKFENKILRSDLYGAGGIYSTVEDLFKWDQNFYKNKLGKGDSSLINKMKKVGMLNNGDKIIYAAGLDIEKYKGLNTVSHGGSFAGYRSYFIQFPDEQFSVIMLANRSDASRPGKTLEVAELYLKDRLKSGEEGNRISEAIVKETELKEEFSKEMLSGTYLSDNYSTYIFSLEKDTLFVNYKWVNAPLPLIRQAGNFFVSEEHEDFSFTFSADKSSGAIKTLIKWEGGQQVVEKIDTMDDSPDALKEYSGIYYSEELDLTYRIFLKGNKLELKVGFDKPDALKALDKDRFLGSQKILNFQRSKDGAITELLLDTRSSNGYIFKRLERTY